MPSKKSTVVSLRLPNDVVDTIEKRVKADAKHKTVSSYLRDRIVYDMTRKHKRHRK